MLSRPKLGVGLNLEDQGADTRAIRAFNEMLHQDGRVTPTLVPIGDELTLAGKQ